MVIIEREELIQLIETNLENGKVNTCDVEWLLQEYKKQQKEIKHYEMRVNSIGFIFKEQVHKERLQLIEDQEKKIKQLENRCKLTYEQGYQSLKEEIEQLKAELKLERISAASYKRELQELKSNQTTCDVCFGTGLSSYGAELGQEHTCGKCNGKGVN